MTFSLVGAHLSARHAATEALLGVLRRTPTLPDLEAGALRLGTAATEALQGTPLIVLRCCQILRLAPLGRHTVCVCLCVCVCDEHGELCDCSWLKKTN